MIPLTSQLSRSVRVALRALWIAGLFGLSLFAAHVGLGVGNGHEGAFQVLYVAIYLIPAALCICRGVLVRQERLPWLLVGIGIAFWAGGYLAAAAWRARESAQAAREGGAVMLVPLLFALVALAITTLDSFTAVSDVAVVLATLVLVLAFIRSPTTFADVRSLALRRELRRRRKLILDSAGDGTYGLDDNGRIVFANAAAAQLTGHAPSTSSRDASLRRTSNSASWHWSGDSQETAHRGASMSAKRILLVDDEDDIREVAAISMQDVGGWQVSSASSGSEAITKALAEQPDAILLDVKMPDMDGPTTFGRLQDEPQTRDIPVILLTAKAQSAGRRHFEKLGVAGVLTKPFDPMSLPDQVAALLASSAQDSRAAIRESA